MGITIKVNGKQCTYDEGTTFLQIAQDFQKEYDSDIALVAEGSKLKELTKKAEDNADITFLTRRDADGRRTYERTAIFVMIKAVREVYGNDINKRIKVEFTIGKGFYISPLGDLVIDDKFISDVKAKMKEIADKNLPIVKTTVSTDKAIEIFKKSGMEEKSCLFRYRRSSFVNLYEIDGFYDYFYGYMLPSTGYIKYFDIVPFDEGCMLMLPSLAEPTVIPEFKPMDNLYNALKTSTEYGEGQGINDVADLNDKICAGELTDIILTQEALQERRISEIARDIAERGGVKFVMIAGPSSSGKTSFSHRLSIQLASFGLRPHPIACDDYFVNREDTPLDENGNYNFECIEAIDTKQFNEDMTRLMKGERVELPTFNFKTGKREYKGNFKQLGKEDILVIEGIHGLNEKMSYALPAESKYKIYISALTTLNVDAHNRIPTTDARLLRRMVRDSRTRGTSAKGTIAMWPSVRRGEEENIFPFQESADAVFNSALIYELAVLKPYAEPLLFAIEKDEPEYFEAKRLLKFLEYFLAVGKDNLPNNSLVREFVGGSIFPVG